MISELTKLGRIRLEKIEKKKIYIYIYINKVPVKLSAQNRRSQPQGSSLKNSEQLLNKMKVFA